MDKLFEIAQYYKNNLIRRKFKFSLERKGKYMSICLSFFSNNFKHLLGLHKLTDIPALSNKSETIYRSILNNKLTYKDICCSKYFEQIENRIENFKYILETIFSKELFFKSLKGNFGTLIRADYLLVNKKHDGYIYLFLIEDRQLVTPVTFFADCEDKYFRQNATNWKILSVEEIIDKK